MSLAFDQSNEIRDLRAQVAELKAVIQSAIEAANRDLEAKRQAELKFKILITRLGGIEGYECCHGQSFIEPCEECGVGSIDGRPLDFEGRIAEWVVSRIGEWAMNSKERAARALEESIELGQAEGITWEKAVAQVHHVYQRPKGNASQEAGGLAVCLLGWLAANNLTFQEVALEELERIEAKPLEEIRGSIKRKSDADLIHGVEQA